MGTFKIEGDGYSVGFDGKVLLLQGNASVGLRGSMALGSLIPVGALSSLTYGDSSRTCDLRLRVWDGPEVAFVFAREPFEAAQDGLVSLVDAVSRTNAAWPLSAARAAAVRRVLRPGYLRDDCLLGPQGIEEFWSPLSELPWEWAAAWRESGHGSEWPLAAVLCTAAAGDVALCLTSTSVVLLSQDAPSVSVDFETLRVPQLDVAPNSTPQAGPGATTRGWLRVSAEGAAVDVGGVGLTELSPLYRYLVLRWAEAQVAQAPSPLDPLQQAAQLVDSGELAPEAYAALADAAVAAVAGVPLSREYPIQERPYLRPPVTAAPVPAPPAPQPRQQAPVRQQPQQNPAVTARKVAAGAAGAAVLWNLLSN